MDKLWGLCRGTPTSGGVCFNNEPYSIARIHPSAYLAVLHTDGSNGANSVGLRVQQRIRGPNEQTSSHHLRSTR